MKLDVTNLRFINKDEWRILTAVEMGMKNHELVPVQLIESIGNLRHTGSYGLLQNLLRNKLVSRDSKVYEGYKLTYLGYDFLALRALSKRGVLSLVGHRIGVGKESDIHIASNEEGRLLCLKLHRLGRISFRNVKNTRDYLRNRTASSWLYLSRLAALKEYSCMRALYENGFDKGDISVPEPIDCNRHAVVMEFIYGVPLSTVRELKSPHEVLERLMKMIVRLADCGLIHCDFNEFNLLIDEDENITLIDFPQIVNTTHINADMYFNRDIRCIKDLFRRKFGIEVIDAPTFNEVIQHQDFTNKIFIEGNVNINSLSLNPSENKIGDNLNIKEYKKYEMKSENFNQSDPESNSQESDIETLTDESEIDNQITRSDVNTKIMQYWLPQKKKTDQAKIRSAAINHNKKHHSSKGNSGSKKSREYRKTKAIIANISSDF
ncbi:RIO1 family protein [Cryptosporidium serpentis]